MHFLTFFKPKFEKTRDLNRRFCVEKRGLHINACQEAKYIIHMRDATDRRIRDDIREDMDAGRNRRHSASGCGETVEAADRMLKGIEELFPDMRPIHAAALDPDPFRCRAVAIVSVEVNPGTREEIEEQLRPVFHAAARLLAPLQPKLPFGFTLALEVAGREKRRRGMDAP